MSPAPKMDWVCLPYLYGGRSSRLGRLVHTAYLSTVVTLRLRISALFTTFYLFAPQTIDTVLYFSSTPGHVGSRPYFSTIYGCIMILASTLLYPDSVNEQGELHHDRYVANLLSQAYVLLSRASSLPAAYEQAYKLASVCLALERSERQSMRVHFVAGTASIGLELHSEGLTHIDEAIELAAELPDPMAYAYLAYLASAVCAHMFSYRQSVNYAKVSLGIIRYLGKYHPLRAPILTSRSTS